MNEALKEIIKSRNHNQREINDAYIKIERYKDQIQGLLDAVLKKEQLVNDFDALIEHSRKLFVNNIEDSVPQIEEEENIENK